MKCKLFGVNFPISIEMNNSLNQWSYTIHLIPTVPSSNNIIHHNFDHGYSFDELAVVYSHSLGPIQLLHVSDQWIRDMISNATITSRVILMAAFPPLWDKILFLIYSLGHGGSFSRISFGLPPYDPPTPKARAWSGDYFNFQVCQSHLHTWEWKDRYMGPQIW